MLDHSGDYAFPFYVKTNIEKKQPRTWIWHINATACN